LLERLPHDFRSFLKALERASWWNSENIVSLISQALAYLGGDFPVPEGPQIEDSITSDENASEFERWNEHRHQTSRGSRKWSRGAPLSRGSAVGQKISLTQLPRQRYGFWSQDRKELLAEKEKRQSNSARANGKPENDPA